jgi:hypothetical protein
MMNSLQDNQQQVDTYIILQDAGAASLAWPQPHNVCNAPIITGQLCRWIYIFVENDGILYDRRLRDPTHLEKSEVPMAIDW